MLTLPLCVWLLSYPKLLPFFCHEWQRVRVSSRHLIITGWASISTLLIIIIVVGVIVIILECLGRRRGRLHEATKARLPSGNTADTGVHLTQRITESVKASIHALKLCHDRIKSHTTRWGRRSWGGWSWKSGRSYRLCLGPPWSELHLTLSNGSSVYSTHDRKMRKKGKRNGKMAKNPRDSWRKNELITGHRILVDIYER